LTWNYKINYMYQCITK